MAMQAKDYVTIPIRMHVIALGPSGSMASVFLLRAACRGVWGRLAGPDLRDNALFPPIAVIEWMNVSFQILDSAKTLRKQRKKEGGQKRGKKEGKKEENRGVEKSKKKKPPPKNEKGPIRFLSIFDID